MWRTPNSLVNDSLNTPVLLKFGNILRRIYFHYNFYLNFLIYICVFFHNISTHMLCIRCQSSHIFWIINTAVLHPLLLFFTYYFSGNMLFWTLTSLFCFLVTMCFLLHCWRDFFRLKIVVSIPYVNYFYSLWCLSSHHLFCLHQSFNSDLFHCMWYFICSINIMKESACWLFPII